MIVNRLTCFSVVLVFLVTIKLSATQVDVGTDTTDITPVDVSNNTICSQCACADRVVDCANRNLTTLFELADWYGLRDFNPIKVNLTHNDITAITRIGKLPIQELNLSNCDIQLFEDASFNNLEDLMVLDLSGNKISTTAISRKVFMGPFGVDGPGDFRKMQYLSLANNDLHTLPQDIFLFMPGLLTLDLSGNPLAFIDQITMGAISDLKSLRELRLSNCDLDSLPEGLLRRHRKLRRLDLSNNKFTTIPSVLRESPSLTFLNLEKNSLQSLDAANPLPNMTKLQELNLSRMSRLQNISAGALSGLSDLLILRLNYNPRLTNLDPDFLVWRNEDEEELWPDLKELYLNNNNLSVLDYGIIDGWNELIAGDFSNNPFNCDCNNQWVVDGLVPFLASTTANATINNMICKRPADLRGLTFAQLYNASKVLACPESESISELPVSNMAIILGIMIGIVVTFPIVLVLVLLWRKGFFSKLRTRKNYDSDDEREDL